MKNTNKSSRKLTVFEYERGVTAGSKTSINLGLNWNYFYV